VKAAVTVCKAVPWLGLLVAGLSPRRPGSVRVGFVVDEVGLGQGFLRVFQFYPVIFRSYICHLEEVESRLRRHSCSSVDMSDKRARRLALFPNCVGLRPNCQTIIWAWLSCLFLRFATKKRKFGSLLHFLSFAVI
jgi:hypothetical protein